MKVFNSLSGNSTDCDLIYLFFFYCFYSLTVPRNETSTWRQHAACNDPQAGERRSYGNAPVWHGLFISPRYYLLSIA